MIEQKVMTFDEFRHFLADALGLAETALTLEAHFLNDLAVESLKLVELILQFEVQLGVRVPTDAAWEIQTVGHAYDYYRNYLAAGGNTA